jgi:hypothetical protein
MFKILILIARKLSLVMGAKLNRKKSGETETDDE